MVRTRYAPSPTGYMHIGNARTALYGYLWAKSQGGVFVLRIEDTDQSRQVEGAVDVIYETLKILGITHDEGPDVGGPYGPYIQSQRKNNYMEMALRLVKEKKAYYCFCPRERLETLTREGAENAVKYDRRCLSLSENEIGENLKNNVPFVIRQLIPEGKTTFKDELFGEITIDNAELDDQVLIKSDGFPTYNFANVIDDNAMGMTHVIRDARYLSSTPKYNLLYEALGWEIPVYIHLPVVCGEDGHVMAKRRGAKSLQDLVSEGYLPEAILNFIALLGWSPADNREFFTIRELIEAFSVKGLSKSPSIADMKKLTWMNGEYIKRMPLEKFLEMAGPVIKETLKRENIDVNKIAAAVQQRVNFINEIPELIDFFNNVPDYDISLYENKKQKTDAQNSLPALRLALEHLSAIEAANWNNDNLYSSLQELASREGLKNSQLLWPVRVALSGKPATPCGATEILELLGKEEALRRIEDGISLLE